MSSTEKKPASLPVEALASMTVIEFVIPGRPVSSQTNSRSNLGKWKRYVEAAASKVWSGKALSAADPPLRFTLVHLCGAAPPDIDNIIKPIQDALRGVIYEDDAVVADVDSHRRFLDKPIDVVDLPTLLQEAVAAGTECVYIRVGASPELGELL